MPDDHRKRLNRQHRRLGLVSHSVIAAFGLAAIATHSAAYAEEPAPAVQTAQAEGEPVTLPPVSAEGTAIQDDYKRSNSANPKFTEPLLDTPRTVNIITKEVIEERGATNLMEVLRTVPGISLGAGEGGITSGDRAFIRGFDSRGDTFIDGARDGGVTIRDSFNYEQIEITKGPSSAMTGRGSTGGSINLITKTPQADDFRTGSLQFGTDATKRATIDWNERLDDNTAFRLNLMAHDAEVAGRDRTEQTRFGFAPSITFGMATDTQLTLSYFHIDTDGYPDYGLPFDGATGKPANVRRENNYGLNGNFQETSADIATVKLDHRFNEIFSLTNQTRYGITTNNYVLHSVGTVAAGATTVNRTGRSRDENRETITNQTNLTSKFAIGEMDNTLLTGIELTRENFNNRGRTISAVAAANVANPDPNVGYTWIYSGNNTDATTDTIGVYAFDTLKLSPQWEVSGGVRYDHVETDATSGLPQAHFANTDDVFSTQAGLLYKPAPNGSIYVSYGTSFNPSAEFDTLTATTANLEPEENVNYELGTKWDLFNERLSLTGALFRVEKTNARVNDVSGTTTILAGLTRVDGIEIGASGSITPEWKLTAGYTYLKSELVDDGPSASNDGKEVPGVAPHNLSLWTTYAFTPKWTVGGGALYMGKRFANAANSQKADGYVRFDAMVAYQLTETVDLRLNAQNLTDEQYYDGLQSSKAIVAPGRTFLLTTDVKF
ncbi:MAG TPA: TonB-dependent siderophore receptor [Alphaproteobacteria bacterium]|nr:TonB-dependent siderophore receptor [Alphaproteobacteria bacterium]